MRLRDRFFLWRNGYCTKHLIPKNFYMELVWCDRCDEEKAARNGAILKGVLARVEAILKEERK